MLLTCDVPMIRYIQHIDQERSRETNLGSFVLRKLDETHLYVRPDVVQMLREKIKELQVCDALRPGTAHCACVPPRRLLTRVCTLRRAGPEHLHKQGSGRRNSGGRRRGRTEQQAAGEAAKDGPGRRLHWQHRHGQHHHSPARAARRCGCSRGSGR